MQQISFSERGDDAIARIKPLTESVGADSVLESVGTQEGMIQAIGCARPGGSFGYLAFLHDVEFDGKTLFFAKKSLVGGPAAVRRFLPDFIDLVLSRTINPGKVFNLEVPLNHAAEDSFVMDER